VTSDAIRGENRVDIASLCLSADDRLAAFNLRIADQLQSNVVDLSARGSHARKMAGRSGGRSALAFSADSKKLWSFGENDWTKWDVAEDQAEQLPGKGRVLAAAAGDAGPVTALPSSNVRLAVIDLSDEKRSWRAPEFGGTVDRVSPPRFDSSGKHLVAGARDGKGEAVIQAWDLDRKSVIHEHVGGSGHSFPSSSGSQVLLDASTLATYDLTTQAENPGTIGTEKTFENYQMFGKFTFSDNGRLCAETGLDGEMAIWELEANRWQRRCIIGRNRPQTFQCQDILVFSPSGGRIAAFDGMRDLAVWNTVTGDELGRLNLSDRPECMAFSDEQEILLARLGREVRAWRPGAAETEMKVVLGTTAELEDERPTWWDHDRNVVFESVQFSRDRSRLAYASASKARGCHTVYCWNTRTGELSTIRTPEVCLGRPRLGIDASGQRLAIQGAMDGLLIANQPAGTNVDYSLVRVSSNGKRAVWVERRGEVFVVCAWDVAAATIVREYPASKRPMAVSISASGDWISWCGENFDDLERSVTLHVVSLREDGPAPGMIRAEAPIDGLDLSPLGNVIAGYSSRTGTATIWRIDTGQRLATFEQENQGARQLALSSSGKRLALLSPRGVLQLWDLHETHRLLALVNLDW
jgi:WD40 repeat protein